MSFFDFLKQAEDDESGAVTVDWVVLAAATVILGGTVINTIKPGLTSGAAVISSGIISATTH